MKLKLTGLVVGDVELTKRQYLHHSTTASTARTTSTIIITPATTTATKAKTTSINSSINSAATNIITGAVTTATKAKGIKVETMGNTEILLNLIETHYAKHRLSRRYIRNALGWVDSIRLKLSGMC